MQQDQHAPETLMQIIKLGRGVHLRCIRGWWHLQFYNRNKTPKHKSIAMDTPIETIAIARAEEIYKLYLRNAKDPWEESIKGVTIESALKRYVKAQTSEHRSPATIRTIEERVGLLKAKVGSTTLIYEITPAEIRKAVYRPGLSRTTQYTRYQTLSAFFNWCIREGLIKESPCAKVRRPSKPDAPAAFIEPVQLKALLHVIETDYEKKQHMLRYQREIIWLRDVIELSVFAGLRVGEVRDLQWKDIQMPTRDGERAWLIVREHDGRGPKWDSEGRLPLPFEALDVLFRLWGLRKSNQEDETVVYSPTGRKIDIKRASRQFKFYAREAKLPADVHLHTLRHTYASWLSQEGVEIATIRDLMRHKYVQTTMRYRHLNPSHLADAQQRAFDGIAKKLEEAEKQKMDEMNHTERFA